MPKNTRVHKCVEKVKAKGGSVSPYAVCQASTHQSFATGKPLGKDTKSTSYKSLIGAVRQTVKDQLNPQSNFSLGR